MGGDFIIWSSKKQSTVTTSSIKVEYIALANATKEAIWLYVLLQELDFFQATATIFMLKSRLANSSVGHSHAKHINIHHHFICECIGHGEISLLCVYKGNAGRHLHQGITL